MSTASRRNSVACLSMLYHFMPICNIVINSQPGRKSEAALLDAFLFSCCQFFFNRSLNTRASAHSITPTPTHTPTHTHTHTHTHMQVDGGKTDSERDLLLFMALLEAQ